MTEGTLSLPIVMCQFLGWATYVLRDIRGEPRCPKTYSSPVWLPEHLVYSARDSYRGYSPLLLGFLVRSWNAKPLLFITFLAPYCTRGAELRLSETCPVRRHLGAVLNRDNEVIQP